MTSLPAGSHSPRSSKNTENLAPIPEELKLEDELVASDELDARRFNPGLAQ